MVTKFPLVVLTTVALAVVSSSVSEWVRAANKDKPTGGCFSKVGCHRVSEYALWDQEGIECRFQI